MIKKFTYFHLFIFTFLSFTIQIKSQVINYNDSWGSSGFTVMDDKSTGIKVNYSLNQVQFSEVKLNGEISKSIQVEGIFLPNNEGAPDLPGTGRFIAIPQGSNISFKVIQMRTETIQNVDIAPAPRIPKDNEDGPLVYNKNQEIYNKDEYYPANPVLISEIMQVRGVDMVILGITPFQYNPVKKELIVYRDIQVEVNFQNGSSKFGDDRLRNRWWDPMLKSMVLNPDQIKDINYNKTSKSLTTDFEYLIITPDNPTFIAWADTIKKFRNEQGIRTGIVTLTQIGGNTTNAIETYINNAYNSWTIPPAAVLILADYGTGAATGTGVTSPIYNNYCISDHIYADVNSDHMADIVFARITAQNATHLATMINKFINYEKNPPTNPNFYDKPITAMGWQTERWFQLCSEIVNGYWEKKLGKHPVRENAIYSGTPGTSWSSNSNTSMITSYFGPTGLNYIPTTPQHLTDWGANATRVNNDINAGAFMMSHRDHGLETGWGEPEYRNTHLTQLNNNDPIFVLSLNCLTGMFNYSSESFAEAFHRHQKGALGLIAATEVSYSFVNDTYTWGMMDEMWPDFMPAYGQTRPSRVMPSFGNVAGKFFLKQSNWPYNTTNKEVTYYLFHHHGDAFTTVYYNMPFDLTVNHNPVIIAGQTSFAVSADSNSLICLSLDGIILATADGNGSPIEMTIPSLVPGNVIKITVTKQNAHRYSQNVLVVPSAGPYVMKESFTINDSTGNNNGKFDYNESIKLSIKLKNVGSVSANNVTLNISSADTLVNITDSTEFYGVIPSDSSLAIHNAFILNAKNGIPDQHIIPISLTATDGVNIWTSSLSLRVNAPNIAYVSFTINDSLGNGNGKIDKGETVFLKVKVKNTGSSKATNIIGNLINSDVNLTVNSSNINFGLVDTNSVVEKQFSISASANSPTGHTIQLQLNLLGDNGVRASSELVVIIGQIPVLIVDVDKNHNSATSIKSTLEGFGITHELINSFPTDLSKYSSLFICLGVYSQNYKLTPAEGTLLKNYLLNGGMIYLEGGDTWYYDTKTDVHPMFNIKGISDGSGDLATLIGQPNTFANGYTFAYSGENSFIDKIDTLNGSIIIFKNKTASNTFYNSMIAYNGTTYKTIGCNFEFGGLPLTAAIKDSLLFKMVDFFGLTGDTPVELASFMGSVKEESVVLNWSTATELNNAFFEVERSNDGLIFIKLSSLKGNGTSTEMHNYTYVDNNLEKLGKYYYRLKQLDLDGTSTYSNTIEVDYNALPKTYSLSQNYPNPFNPSTRIKFALPKASNVTLIIYDALGRVVETLVNGKMDAGFYNYEWVASNFATGMYIYRLHADDFTSSKKLLLVK